MKITLRLRHDHEVLKALFNNFIKPSGTRGQNGKKDLLLQIERELLMHSQMEQEIFYPALMATSSARAVELVHKAEQEHGSIDNLLQELVGMSGSEKDFEARVASLINEVNRHIDMEEEEMFDEARKNLPEFRLEELGIEMEDRQRILTTLAA